ncbi:MAG: hypothetical protein ACI3YM_02180 [Prevotella sp.]
MAIKVYTFKELRKHGVNFDYIITLNKNEDGTLKRVDYPITCLNSLFNKLEIMFNDDERYDVVDMENAILHEICIKNINICIPHEYHAAFINGSERGGSNLIAYNAIDQQKTRSSNDFKKASILLAHIKRLGLKNKKLTVNEIDMLSALTNKEYLVYIHKEKMDFLRQRMGYLHAYAYKMTYDSISKNVFFISSERIGWPSNKERGCPTWLYEINDDIKISLWSNFCYGNSSAFFIRVFYKGLQLCPYSEFVTYRYAREADILNYTRKYELKRESWEAAADFVLNFCNKAITDPDNFIKQEITYEVKTLIQELSQIVISKEHYLKCKFETSIPLNTRFSHVADLIEFNEYQLADYQNNPAEYELLFRMEKVSGALRFVNSLSSFSTIYNFISKAIETIEKLNVEIYPELTARIIPIREEVTKLKEELLTLSTEYDKLKKKMERHYRTIEIIQNRYKQTENKETAKNNYYKRHPELTELENMINKLNGELCPQKHLLYMREKFLNSLEKCKSNIEDYDITILKK